MRFLFKLILFGRFHQNFLTREIYFEMILVAKLLFKMSFTLFEMFSFSQKVVKIFSLVTFLFKGLAAGKIGFPGQTASSGRTFIINFIHRHLQHCHCTINKILDLDLWIEYVIPALLPILLHTCTSEPKQIYPSAVFLTLCHLDLIGNPRPSAASFLVRVRPK